VETLGELSLAVGDVVVYAGHGVGRVAKRGDQSVVVEFATNGLTVILPLERALASIRRVSSETELVGVGRALGAADPDIHSDWQRRLKATKAKLIDGEALSLAEVIRDASRREERASARNEPGKLSVTERQLYLRARLLLANEVGASRGIDPAHADEWITEQLAANADQNRVPLTPDVTRFNRQLVASAEPFGNRARRRRP